MTTDKSWRLRLRTFVLVLVGLEVLYLLAANVFLNTSLGPHTINRKPEKWSLVWSGGWSLIPGRVHISRVIFEQHGKRHDFLASADRAAVDIGVLALLRRCFLTESLIVRGVRGAVVRRQENDSLPEPPKAPRRSPGWTLALHGFEVEDLRSFAFDEVVFEGAEGRIAADFELIVRDKVSLAGGHLDWRDIVLRQGEEELAGPLTLTFDGGFSPFDPREEKGFAVLDHLSGRLGIEGTVARFSILRRFLARAEWIETLDGTGHLAATLEVEEGLIAPGSLLAATADDLRLDFLGYATKGTGRVEGTVSGAGGEDRLAQMAVTFDDFTLRRKPSADPHVLGRGLRLVATSKDPNLRDGMQDLDVVLDMPQAEVPNMAVYGAYLPAHLGLAIDSGSGRMRFHLEGSAVEQTASGEIELLAEKVGGHFQDLEFEGGLEVQTKISGGDLDDLHLEIVGTRMAVLDVVLSDGGNTAEKDWWMTVDVPIGTLEIGEAPELTAELDILMKDSRAVMALFGEVKPWLDRFERILTVKDIEAHAKVAMKEQHLSLRDLSIDGRKLEGRAELALSKDLREGILFVRFHGIPVGLEITGTERDWKLVNARKWFEGKVAADWTDEGPSP